MRIRITALPVTLATLTPASAALGQEVIKDWVMPSTTLCSRGDLDGDGIRDLVITSSTSTLGYGVYAYSGATDALLWFVPAPSAVHDPKFGAALEHAGDIDRDGKDDVLVGAPRQLIGTSYGSAHVLSGVDGTYLHTLHPPGSAGVYGAEFGSALAGGDDIDGDDVPDFAVGAMGTSGAIERVGAVFVYSGATGSLIRQYSGSTKDQALGSAVALLEVDGDRLADLAISSQGLPTVPATGAVEIYSGAGNSLIVTILAPTPTKSFGRALRPLDDLDGDGADDLAIGSPYHSQATPGGASLYLVSGASGSVLSSFGDSTSQLGAILGGGDDLDGDGYDDVIVGDPWVTVDGVENCGRVHAISGATGRQLWTYTDATMGQARIGTAVGTTDDITGDGRAEVFVTAPTAEVTFLNSGRVRLLSSVDCGDVSPFGIACGDDYFFTPKLNLIGCPRVNSTITLHVETNLPTTGMMVLGTRQAALPLPSGCTLLVGLPLIAIGPFYVPGLGTGYELTGTVPPVAAPLVFHAQAIVRAAPQSWAIDSSRGISVTIEP